MQIIFMKVYTCIYQVVVRGRNVVVIIPHSFSLSPSHPRTVTLTPSHPCSWINRLLPTLQPFPRTRTTNQIARQHQNSSTLPPVLLPWNQGHTHLMGRRGVSHCREHILLPSPTPHPLTARYMYIVYKGMAVGDCCSLLILVLYYRNLYIVV